MPFVNYQRRPLVFNEMGKPINDLSMEDAIKEANLDYKVGIKETRVRLEDPANPGSFLLYKVPNSFATYREDTNHVFGAVGSKYEVVQNSVALDLLIKYVITIRVFVLKLPVAIRMAQVCL